MRAVKFTLKISKIVKILNNLKSFPFALTKNFWEIYVLYFLNTLVICKDVGHL